MSMTFNYLKYFSRQGSAKKDSVNRMIRQPARFLAAAQEIPDSTVYVCSCGRVSQTCPQEVFRRRRGRSMSNFYWARGSGLRLRCQRRRGGASGPRGPPCLSCNHVGAETLRRSACRPLVKIRLPSAGNEMSAAAAVCYISTGNFNKNVADFKVCVAVSQPARFAPAAQKNGIRLTESFLDYPCVAPEALQTPVSCLDSGCAHSAARRGRWRASSPSP